uniref:Uncharacterized protein n=1 Tax=Amblyomma triste TaxID=251400 RepID=A0A023G3J8_AMBTT
MLDIMFQGPVVATVHKQSGDLHYVELTSKKGGQSLNQQLVAKGLAVDLKAAASSTAASTTASAAVTPGTMSDQQPERLSTVLELVKVGDKLPMQVTMSAKGVVWCLCLMQELAGPLIKAEKALLIEGTKLGGENRAHEAET